MAVRTLPERLNAMRTSFWFIPATMAIGSAIAAVLLLTFEVRVPIWRDVGEDADAGLLLSTLAGSIITVTGVVFSLTIVTLHLASNQFGPRLLRNFMRDRGNQVVLGTFVATFVFCVMSLVARPRPDTLLVTVALVLMGASVALFIYFLHHMAVAIQAETVVANVTEHLEHQIDTLYPEDVETDDGTGLPETNPTPVHAKDDGYVVSIDRQRLVKQASTTGAAFRLLVREGQYIVQGDLVLLAWADAEASDKALRAVSLGSKRTEEHDIEFRIQQLAEMAVRALSPGINDPFTAMSCIDRLTSSYCRMAKRDDSARIQRQGPSVLVWPRATFSQMLASGFGAIRHHVRSPESQAHLIEALGRVGQRTRDPRRRAAVEEHLQALMEHVEATEPPSADLSALRQKRDEALAAMQASHVPPP